MSATVVARFVIDEDGTVTRAGSTAAWPCTTPAAAHSLVHRQAKLLAHRAGGPVTVAVESAEGIQMLRATSDSVTLLLDRERLSVVEDDVDDPAEGEPERRSRPKHRRSRAAARGPQQRASRSAAWAKVGALSVAVLAVAGPLGASYLGQQSGGTAGAAALRSPLPASATTPALPAACLGGPDLVSGARLGSSQAVDSTIEQNGLTVPSPSGAAAAAASFVRLRTEMPEPIGRSAALAELLATDATPAARKIPPTPGGQSTRVDMKDARWQLVSGNGSAATVALRLDRVTTRKGVTSAPEPFVVQVSLVADRGRWLLKDVSPSPLSTDQFTNAPRFTHTEACA